MFVGVIFWGAFSIGETFAIYATPNY